MKQKSIFLLLSLLFLIHWGLYSSPTSDEKHALSNPKAHIDSINILLVRALYDNDIVGVKMFFSDTLLIKTGEEINWIVSEMSKALSSKQFHLLNEFYINNEITQNILPLPSKIPEGTEYMVNINTFTEESYLCMIIPEGSKNEMLITVLYGKYGNEWKINFFHLGNYSVFNKNAMELYRMAKESYAKSYLIDAVNYTGLAIVCLDTSNKSLFYPKEKEILAFGDKLMEEVNSQYSFPITLEYVDTKPQVWAIAPEVVPDGIFPIIKYVTKVDIKDTEALKREYEQIRKGIGSVFKGIDKDKDVVIYRALSGFPDGKTEIRGYGFIDDIVK